jgi:hypothetical protein
MANISASAFNAIQKKVAAVVGTNGINTGSVTVSSTFGGATYTVTDGTFNYGQAVASRQVSTGGVIRATDWSNLRSDLAKARGYQKGTISVGSTNANPWTTLASIVANATVITAAIQSQYSNVADACVVDRLGVVNALDTTSVTTSTRSTAWGTVALNAAVTVGGTLVLSAGTIYQQVTLTFTDANQLKYFFNTGGEVRFSATRTGGTATNKNTSWTNMLAACGTVKIGRTATTATGSGTGSVLGGTNLTSTDQLLYQSAAVATPYAANYFRVYGKTTASNVLVLTATFQDLDLGTQTGIGPAVDETVDGSLASTMTLARANSGVIVAAPGIAVSGTLV